MGPALADEIAKDFANPSSRLDGINEDTLAPSSLSPPVTRAKTKPKPAPPTPSRRISTRKRPAPDLEPEPLFLPNDDGGDDDAEWEPDAGEDIVPKSVSAIGRNTRQRGVKRVRLSDPGPIPARSTRSKDAASASVSTMTLRSSPKSKPTRPATRASVNESASVKRSSRRSRGKAPIEEDEDADADADGEDEIESGDETGERFTGPSALAAALTRASKQSGTSRARARPPTTSRAQKPTVTITTRPKATTSAPPRTRSGPSTDNAAGAPRTSKRTIKPTVKGALLKPTKAQLSILSRPIRPHAMRQAQVQTARRGTGRRVLAGVALPSASWAQVDVDGRSESPKEVFDGVVLKKRRVMARSKSASQDIGDRQDLAVQLDEFVANGIERENARDGNENGMGTSDPVLERDDASSLGGSNKGK